MVFSAGPKAQRSRSAVVVSALFHAGVTALVVFALHMATAPVVQYQSRRGTTTTLYWNGAGAAGATKPRAAHRPAVRRAVTPARSRAAIAPPVVPQEQQAPAASGPAPAPQQPTPGSGSGSEDAEPALPVYYPSPGVTDRSLLPASEQNIVVEVSISAGGDVTDEKLVKGLGNSIDQLVLDTVKGWRFHPATLNGNAIASTEQLVFPFKRDEPSAGSKG